LGGSVSPQEACYLAYQMSNGRWWMNQDFGQLRAETIAARAGILKSAVDRATVVGIQDKPVFTRHLSVEQILTLIVENVQQSAGYRCQILSEPSGQLLAPAAIQRLRSLINHHFAVFEIEVERLPNRALTDIPAHRDRSYHRERHRDAKRNKELPEEFHASVSGVTRT